jgi:hypothetical protein
MVVCSNGLQLYMHQIVGIDLKTGTFLQPTTRKGKPRSPKVARLMEKLPQPYPSTKASTNFLSFSSKALLIPFGFHI